MLSLSQRRTQLTVIIMVAVLIRLGVMFALQTYQFKSERAYGYSNARVAFHVMTGRGFSLSANEAGGLNKTAITPPGYVYVLAGIFKIFGPYTVMSAIVIETIQALISSLTCLLFYLLGRRFHEHIGLLAAAAMAVYPSAIFFSVVRIGPAPVVVLLLALMMHYLLKLQENPQTRDAVICGVLMGLNALFEPAVILFYVLACIWLLLWRSRARLAAVTHAFVMGIVCMVLVLPWTIRNYMVFHTFVPLKSSMGRNLLEGSHPQGTGVIHHFGIPEVLSLEELKIFRSSNELQKDKMLFHKAVEFIQDDPKYFLHSTLRRIFYFWAPLNPYRTTPHDTLRLVTYGPVLILAIFGILLMRQKWLETTLVLALFFSYPLPYYITHVSINRYKFIVEPFLVLLASYAVLTLIRRLKPRAIPVAAG